MLEIISSTIRSILFGNPNHSWILMAFTWLIRLVVLSLLLRTYIIPWLLTLTSKHIRVKSISLRSIRGLYIRAGVHSCRVDRITYAWTPVAGERRINIIIEGLNLGLSSAIAPKPIRHKRTLTLADLSPSPLAGLVRELWGDLYTLLDPYLRPYIRVLVVNCLRFFIRWVPRISRAVTFDLHSATITLPDTQKTEINAEKLQLHTTLSLTPLGNLGENVDDGSTARVTPSRPPRRMGVWKRRFKDGFRRSLDRALGDTKATANVSLQLQGVHVLTGSQISECKPLIRLPGRLDLDASVSFNPRAGVMDEQSLEASIRVGDCVVHADSILSFLDELKKSTHIVSEPAPVLASSFEPLNDLPETTTPALPMDSRLSNYPLSTPESTFFSPLLSSRVPSISALASPASPFLEAISTSLRSSLQSRRHRFIVPCQRLKAQQYNSALTFLQRIRVDLSKIDVVYITTSDKFEHSYQATFQSMTLEVFRSLPTNNPFHVEVLGRSNNSECYDPEVYGLSFSVEATSLKRHTIKDVWHLLTVGQIDLRALASQWPFPWLIASPFMSNDPNAAILAFRGHIGSAVVTERIEDLRLLLDLFGSSEPAPLKNSGASAELKPFPRLSIDFSSGPLVASIICKAPDGYKALAVKLRTGGLCGSLSSRYQDDKVSSIAKSEHELILQSEASLVIDPVFALVYSDPDKAKIASGELAEVDLTHHPTALSLETVDIRCRVGASGTIDDRIGSVACVDTSTLTADVRISGDAFCIELWHPDVVAAILQIVTVLPSKERDPSVGPFQSSKSHRALGISVAAGLGRLVVFLTSPDLNPNDDLGLSRGVALRTTVSLHLCSLGARHLRFLGNFHERSLRRQKLDLRQEICIDAAAFRPPHIALQSPRVIRLSISNLLLRGAVATPFEADDPLIIESDGPAFVGQDFLCVDRAEFKMLHGSQPQSTVCIDIPTVKFGFELLHVYELMLAFQTLRSIQQIMSRASANTPSSNLALRVEVDISSIQIVWILPKQKLLTTVHSFVAVYSGNRSIDVRFNQAKLSTSLTSKPDNADADDTTIGMWEELIDLQMWHMQFPQDLSQPKITIGGRSGLVKIPSGYIFADLVFDIAVLSKAFRHILRMTARGFYQDFQEPEPEGPKMVPHVKINIGNVAVEASDDPFESQFGLIWRTGLEAVKTRLEREKAFETKVATIYAAETGLANGAFAPTEYRFDATHTISVQDARRRLDEVHALDWIFRLGQERQKVTQTEQTFVQSLRSTIGSASGLSSASDSTIAQGSSSPKIPPLFRGVIFDLDLRLSPPSFSLAHLPKFLFEQGNLPRDTVYSLLVPMHIHFTLSCLHVTLRDYPLPLISIPAPRDKANIAWECNTDLVIAEEMGTDKSVDWIECPIVQRDRGAQGVQPFSVTVPKTIMPVKSYANPIINVTTSRPTIFTWGVSYGPAIQDLMRIIDTLSSVSRDDSPPIGFWDKMKLIFHWTLRVSFEGEVLLHLKGSRDPYSVTDAGAGFVFCWNGNTKLLVNRENDDKELLQITSDTLTLAIPDLDDVTYNQSHHSNSRYNATVFRKICARFQSAVRFGIGVMLERTCTPRCTSCSGSPFQRGCRIFDFVPHHKVKLEKKNKVPELNGLDDSFSGFRSDFIHLSVSLTSCAGNTSRQHNSLHLSTKLFAHFWSWWSLFDGALSLPIRQGSYYPRRVITPKLGRHLATIKYRLSVSHLYVMHGYLDDAEESKDDPVAFAAFVRLTYHPAWTDGISPWVGLKGMIDHFQADLHQRDEEASVAGMDQAPKSLRRKAFCAAEVVLKGIDLRALVATFSDPAKQKIIAESGPQRSNYRGRADSPGFDLNHPWYDPADYVETDWSSTEDPKLHIVPIATCPYFAYSKRSAAFARDRRVSKFGVETSHTCLLGTEPSVYHVQIALAEARIKELEKEKRSQGLQDLEAGATKLDRMIILLREYISLINSSYMSPDNDRARNYLIPSETVSPYEWAEFDNVYQVHSPIAYLDAAIRDILVRYYYCSRVRRGFEYHLATRAVKFIRDQANAALDDLGPERSLSPTQAAASALRKILKTDEPPKEFDDLFSDDIPKSLDSVNPLDGWPDGVSLMKSHYCLLLKPQVVLRGEPDSESCIVAAIQAKLQSFAIMDDMNVDDPISGKVMSRNYATLLGLQAFSPSNSAIVHGRVPLEVLVDLKCESDEFDRLIPQTNAVFHYDKFNRLRLRNNVNSAVERRSKGKTRMALQGTSHLRDQTDLLRIHIPRFSVSASDRHFQCIANIVTELILFSDAAHKTRLARLENLLIKYDFTDLGSAAAVVENLQYLLRNVLENERQIQASLRQSTNDVTRTDLLHIQARALALAEELDLLFDAIRLAQDKSDVKNDRKSALLFNASSSVMSWNMLADGRDLISKLEVQETNFYWLSRQDGSTVNNLRIGNLEAFDGSQHAQWAEILSKYDEPANHPLLKRGLLLVADWVILSPVGGITIYETFELSLHPIRLQIDSRVGRRIMEYLWPGRKDRYKAAEDDETDAISLDELDDPPHTVSPTRTSLDSPRALQSLERQSQNSLTPPTHKLAVSRSYTDLRSPKSTSHTHTLTVLANQSTESLTTPAPLRSNRGPKLTFSSSQNDVAAEMRTRSGQKTFILIKISSLDLLLSVLKEGSFECHDAHIKTRQLEYRNKTWSFEELVDQFIPSNMNWRGWVKMALQQPLLPVFPVARELFMKTKFSRGGSPAIAPRDNEASLVPTDKNQATGKLVEGQKHSALRKPREKKPDPTATTETGQLTSTHIGQEGSTRTRVLSIFGRGKR